MKKSLLFTFILFGTLTFVSAQQTNVKPANVSKEIAKLVKKLPLAEQEILLTQLKRAVAAKEANEAAAKAVAEAAKAENKDDIVAVKESPKAMAPAITVTPAQAPASPAQEATTSVKSSAAENKAFMPATPAVPAKEEFITKAETMPKTTIKWEEETYDFGKITEGDVVSHTYKFTNTGNNPLLITNIKVGCGCTTPSWTKEAVAPGGQGSVELKFNSAHKSGVQIKSVTMYMNTEPVVRTLSFKGEVNPKVATTPPAGGH